jgi:hypothetical protein
MATSTTSGFSVSASAAVVPMRQAKTNRGRRITPEAGHALEILGHAIEYLSDEFVHEGGDFNAHNPQLEAVQLLMALNRQVYFECPQVPTFRERCRSFLRRHFL